MWYRTLAACPVAGVFGCQQLFNITPRNYRRGVESGPAHGHGQLQAVLHWMRVQAKYYVMLMSSLPSLGSICVGFGLLLSREIICENGVRVPSAVLNFGSKSIGKNI